MNTFEQSLHIGAIGEKITDRILKDRGVSIFKPAFPHESNVIDRVGITSKGRFIFSETKCYPRRFVRPEQGIDKADLIKYVRIITKNPSIYFMVFFVDAFERKVLAFNLSAHFKAGRIEGNKVYFPLDLMSPIYDLGQEDLAAINWRFDERYRKVERFFH